MSSIKKMQQIKDVLQHITDTQCKRGTYDQNPYMHGLANGLIIAMSVLDDENPVFLKAPKFWKEDLEMLDIFNKSSTIVKNS